MLYEELPPFYACFMDFMAVGKKRKVFFFFDLMSQYVHALLTDEEGEEISAFALSLASSAVMCCVFA